MPCTYFFAGRIKRDAVEFAKRVDLIPILPSVAILQCDVIGARGRPSLALASGFKAAPLDQKFWEPRDAFGDPSRFVGREVLQVESLMLASIVGGRSSSWANGILVFMGIIALSYAMARSEKTANAFSLIMGAIWGVVIWQIATSLETAPSSARPEAYPGGMACSRCRWRNCWSKKPSANWGNAPGQSLLSTFLSRPALNSCFNFPQR